MPITKSAIKKVKVDERKRGFNKIVSTKALKAIKSFRKSPKKNDLPKLFSAIDRAAKKRIFHKKKADRLKSRLSKLVEKK
jgi:small subunit ribosomal protein S20